MILLKKIIKIFGVALSIFIACIILYLASAFCLSLISVNDGVETNKEVKIYILTNGVHTDLVVPLRSEIMDWSRYVRFENIVNKNTSAQYVAFGMGDKQFYLETPTWADLQLRIAFKAAFGLGTAAIHTTFYQQITESKNCKSIYLSQADYQQLVNYIFNSFQKDSSDQFMHIQGHHYGKNDAFYEAVGRYSLLHTCNTWANNGLKAAGQKACLWTPFDMGIFYHYSNQ